jgi:predicted amidohydrolase
MGRDVRVAALQLGPIVDEPEKSVEKALRWLDKAAAAKVQLAVFPEFYYPDYSLLLGLKGLGDNAYDGQLKRLKSSAETIPGPVSDRIAKKAKEHGMHVVFCMLEKDEKRDVFYSASVLLSSRGRVLNVHRKTVLSPGLETPLLDAGNEFNISKTEIGAIGQLICADASCPESARILAIKGAEIICLSVGFFYETRGGREVKVRYLEECHGSRSRAIDNSAFLVTSNLAGWLRSFEFFGKSRIVGPMGDVLAQGGEGADREMIVTADINLDETSAENQLVFRMIDRRRPEIYGEIVQLDRGARQSG